MKRWMGWLLLAGCVAASAGEADDPMLPPADLVLHAISSTPEVRRAEAGVTTADAQARMRAAGSYEGQGTVIPSVAVSKAIATTTSGSST